MCIKTSEVFETAEVFLSRLQSALPAQHRSFTWLLCNNVNDIMKYEKEAGFIFWHDYTTPNSMNIGPSLMTF